MERIFLPLQKDSTNTLFPTITEEKSSKVTSSVASSIQPVLRGCEIPIISFHEPKNGEESLKERSAYNKHSSRPNFEEDAEDVLQIKVESARRISYGNDPLTKIARFVSAVGQDFGCIKSEPEDFEINLHPATDHNEKESTECQMKAFVNQIEDVPRNIASYGNDPFTSIARFVSAVGQDFGCIKSEVEDPLDPLAEEIHIESASEESYAELRKSRLETFVSYLPRFLQAIAYECFGVRQIGGGGRRNESDSDEELTEAEVRYGIVMELKTQKRESLSRIKNLDTYIDHMQGKRKRENDPLSSSSIKRRKLSSSDDHFSYTDESPVVDEDGGSSQNLNHDPGEAHHKKSQLNSSNLTEDDEISSSRSTSHEAEEVKDCSDSILKCGQKFDDFKAFEESLKEFKMKSLTHLKKSHANKNLCKGDDGKKFPFRCVTYICSHGGPIRCRSKNIRPGQSYHTTNCPVKVYVKLQKDSSTSKKFYEVTDLVSAHEGHEVSKEAFLLHIQGRRPSAGEKDLILKYIDMNVPVREIRKEVYKETGKILSSQDVGNLERQAKKNAGTPESDIKETLELLKKKHEADIGSTLKVVYSKEESSGKSIVNIIYWQSSSQKAALKKNGQIIFIDGTYKLTNLDYVLYPIHVIDEHRKTKLIAWGLLFNEKRSVLNEFLQIFVDANRSSSEMIKFVSIDKSFNEIAALGTVLPSAKFILCRVHVLKTVKDHIGKIRLPSSKQFMKQQLEKLFQKMVHSPAENNYMDAWEEILKLANENPELEKFARYLEENWHSCRDHFAECKIGKLYHFNTKTNNRSENFNMQLKQKVRKQSRVPIVVNALLDMEADQTRKTAMRDYESLCKQYKPVNLEDSTKVAELLQCGRNVVMKEALKLMQIQCELSIKASEDDLKRDVDQLKCTRLRGECGFYSNYKLPCKHLFATRNLNDEDVFDVKMIPRHWLVDKNLAENEVDEPKDDVVFTKSKSCSSLASGYNASKRDLQEFQETLSKCSKVDQEIYIKMIRTMNEALKKKRTVTYDDGEMYVETKEEDIESSQLSNENIEETLEFSSARKSHKKIQGHTVFKGKKTEHCSGQSTEKRKDLDLQVPGDGDHLPDWMMKINHQMKKLGAVNTWTEQDFDILTKKSKLEGQNLWLSDSHFHYFTVLFNHQFKSLQKIQDTILADCATGLRKINEKEDFIQPVHAGDHHWAMVTNIGVPPSEREFTIIAYDSLINMTTKDQCQIREKMKWQAVQLLRPETQGNRKGMAMFVKPCHQQPNGNDCGLFAIANCIALAYGHDPSTIYYTGDLRQEFLEMIRKTEIRMFSFQPRSTTNEKAFSTDIPISRHVSVHSQIPIIKHCFDIVCHCGMPLSWGNTADCDKCKETYHIQCYLVNNESQIVSQLREFQCYKCRRPGCYDFLQENIRESGDTKDRILKVAKSISALPSSRLRFHLPNVVNHKQDRNHFFNMKSYLKFEEILAKYDLNSVAQRVGEIYNAIDEYYHRSSTELRGAVSWNKMSESQIVHLAVLLICEVSKTNLPPLYNLLEEGQKDALSDDELLKNNSKWIAVLEKTMNKVKTDTESLLDKGTSYAKAMPEISTLRKELQELSLQAHIILDELGKRGAADGENTQSSFKFGQIASLRNILMDHKECCDNLDKIQKR